MSFIQFLRDELPIQLKISIASGLAGSTAGIYTFITDEKWLKLASALATWGALVTMLLAWASYIYQLKKKRRRPNERRKTDD